MNIVVKRKDETSVTYEEITDLMHRSFEERLQQGLNFTCSFMTIETFKEKTKNGYLLVALDADTDKLLGTTTFQVRKDEHGCIYGYNELLAVSPDFKRCGVGAKLEKAYTDLAKKTECAYIMADTAVGATSSIKYHLNCGFKIVGLMSSPSTNYYSYLFRKQLNKSFVWNNFLYCKFVFLWSFFKTKLKMRQDGSFRDIFKFYLSVKEKCKR